MDNSLNILSPKNSSLFSHFRTLQLFAHSIQFSYSPGLSTPVYEEDAGAHGEDEGGGDDAGYDDGCYSDYDDGYGDFDW